MQLPTHMLPNGRVKLQRLAVHCVTQLRKRLLSVPQLTGGPTARQFLRDTILSILRQQTVGKSATDQRVHRGMAMHNDIAQTGHFCHRRHKYRKMWAVNMHGLPSSLMLQEKSTHLFGRQNIFRFWKVHFISMTTQSFDLRPAVCLRV